MRMLQTHSVNEQLKEILIELRRRFAEIYGDRLVHLILYGSRARGDAAPDSDIDVLVVLNGVVNPGDEISRTGKITAALSLHYSVVISCVFVSAERYFTEQSPLLLNVRREGVSI
jgi:predicted nucleotidyltransferase